VSSADKMIIQTLREQGYEINHKIIKRIIVYRITLLMTSLSVSRYSIILK